MAHTETTVTGTRERGLQLPEFLRMFAAVMTALRTGGVTAQLSERVRWNRQGGYHPVDTVVFLLCYFLSTAGKKAPGSMGTLSRTVAGWRKELASFADREDFATQASVSRTLATAQRCDLNGVGRWMLGEASMAGPLLSDAASMYRDGNGGFWCTLDWDAIIIPLRKRGLPHDPELAEAVLRAAAVGTPGYSGRQRGEVQLAVHILQHAGAGIFGYVDLEPGNPHPADKAKEICLAALEMSRLAGIAPQRTLVRMDGAGDVTVLIAALVAHQLVPLVRMCRYALLESASARLQIETGVWLAVPDALSGPRRQALDLGDYDLLPEGTDSDPLGAAVTIRLVVSRFAAESKHGAGYMMGDYHYELFGTALPAAGWTAAEVVQCYFGRAAIENRFAQLNREVKVLRLHSLNLAGQRLAMTIGLWAFNLKTALGYRLVEPTASLPAQRPADPAVPALPAVCAEPARAPDTTGIAEATVDAPGTPAPPSASAQSAAIPMAESSAADQVSPPVFQQTIREAIARLPWSRALRKHQDWTWKDQELRCPQGNLASFSGVILQGNRKYARFTIGAVYCFGCPLRAKCTKSANPGYARTINVPRADELPTGIHLGKNKTSAAWHEPALNQRLRPPASTPAGPCKVAAPLLVPTVLRDKLRKLIDLTRVEVDAPPSPKAPRPPEHLAATPERRQRRRADWATRIAANARTSPTRIGIRVWEHGGRNQAAQLRAVLKL